MKIIVEKNSSELDHSVTKKDIKTVLRIVPNDWIGVAHIFLISAQKFENSEWDRPVILNNTTFRILSRGIEKNQIIKALLIEMAMNSTKIHPAYGHRLTQEQERKLGRYVEPYYKDIIRELTMPNKL